MRSPALGKSSPGLAARAPPFPKAKWGQRKQEFGIDMYTLFSVQKSNQQGPLPDILE